jgi:hypothetical protein
MYPWRAAGSRESGQVGEGALKICDLCGALNLAANSECFSCGWHGRFERRAEIVRLAVELYQRRHGRLQLDQLTNRRVFAQSPPRRVRSGVVRLFSSARRFLFG